MDAGSVVFGAVLGLCAAAVVLLVRDRLKYGDWSWGWWRWYG